MRHAAPARRLLPLLGFVALAAWTWSPTGAWEGTFSTPHGEQPLALELTGGDGAWHGRGVAGTTDMGAAHDVTELEVKGDSVSFTLGLQTQMGAGKMVMRGAFSGDVGQGVYDMTIEGMPTPLKGRWSVKRK